MKSSRNTATFPGLHEFFFKLDQAGTSKIDQEKITLEKFARNGFKTWDEYEKRVRALEKLGCSRSDAQGIADAEVAEENFDEWK